MVERTLEGIRRELDRRDLEMGRRRVLLSRELRFRVELAGMEG